MARDISNLDNFVGRDYLGGVAALENNMGLIMMDGEFVELGGAGDSMRDHGYDGEAAVAAVDAAIEEKLRQAAEDGDDTFIYNTLVDKCNCLPAFRDWVKRQVDKNPLPPVDTPDWATMPFNLRELREELEKTK